MRWPPPPSTSATRTRPGSGPYENTNGLLRDDFPKGTDLTVHTAGDLSAVQEELNGCRRRSIYTKYRCGVAETTTIRISRDTHERVKRLAAERHETIDETVSRAIRALRQDAMARDLAADLSGDETAWLDADAG